MGLISKKKYHSSGLGVVKILYIPILINLIFLNKNINNSYKEIKLWSFIKISLVYSKIFYTKEKISWVKVEVKKVSLIKNMENSFLLYGIMDKNKEATLEGKPTSWESSGSSHSKKIINFQQPLWTF